MKNQILSVLFPAIIFLAIGCLSVYYLVARPTSTIELNNVEMDIITMPSAVSMQGEIEIGRVWKKYPDYMIGYSALAILGFSGSILCAYNGSREITPE